MELVGGLLLEGTLDLGNDGSEFFFIIGGLGGRDAVNPLLLPNVVSLSDKEDEPLFSIPGVFLDATLRAIFSLMGWSRFLLELEGILELLASFTLTLLASNTLSELSFSFKDLLRIRGEDLGDFMSTAEWDGS